MSANIWLLSRIKWYLSIEHRVVFYKSYIQPHIDYANIVWGNAAKTNLLHIGRLQRRACRVILIYNVEDIHQSMDDLKIMTFWERVFLRKEKFMFKVSNNITPDYINSLFTKHQQNDYNGNESYILLQCLPIILFCLSQGQNYTRTVCFFLVLWFGIAWPKK